VKVTIGSKLCELTLLLTDKLTCRLPVTKPLAAGFDPGVEEVVAYVGQNRYVVGKLSYNSETNIPVIIGASGGSAVVVAIVLGIAFFYFRKMKKKTMEEREEQMKRLDEV
jgi:shikimate kinase